MSDKGPKGYADLAELPEDERIEMIGATAAGGQVVGFIVDADAEGDAIAARYIRKLAERFPTVAVIDITRGPVEGTLLVRCGPATATAEDAT